MKKLFVMFALTLLSATVAMAAARDRHYDLLVAPARYSVLQVMFDVVANRPSVLVSYQGEATTAEPLLHVWNGTTWNPITLHDLRELSFVQKTPTRAVLIGGDDLLPVSVRESLAWMPEVVYVRELNNTSLLNEFGRLQKWSKREWNWFSTRYNLTLEDEAAPLRERSWYDRSPATLPKHNDAAPSYQPAPVSSPREPMAPPSSLPLQSEVKRPSDVPAAPVTVSEVDAAVPVTAQNAPAAVVDQIITETSEVVEVVEPTAADSAPIK